MGLKILQELGKRLLAPSGKEPGTQQDEPHVKDTLSEEGEARHQADGQDTGAIEGNMALIHKHQRDKGDDRYIGQRRAETGQREIVGDQHIVGQQDLEEALKDLLGA